MHNDKVLNVSENTLIRKPLIESQNLSMNFLVFLTNLGFGFLTVTETALVPRSNIPNANIAEKMIDRA